MNRFNKWMFIFWTITDGCDGEFQDCPVLTTDDSAEEREKNLLLSLQFQILTGAESLLFKPLKPELYNLNLEMTLFRPPELWFKG